MISQAGDLARRLARYAEAVCRHYLSNGCRRGRYWVIGDAINTPGRSLYVRLTGPDSSPGAAGKWTDAASPSAHGDLLDLIRLNRNLNGLGEAMNEARRFLALPQPATPAPMSQAPSTARRSPDAARRLFAASCPIPGTPAEAYLRGRGITARLDWPALRYHPSVYYRASEDAPLESWPALLAAVTNLEGIITGIQRTWLDPRRSTKAPLADPRRALGHLLGNGVRFGAATKPALAQAGVLAAGEGIETMLALKSVLPSLSVVAGLSATHLAALDLPPRFKPGAGSGLHRVYIARDNDAAGLKAAHRLHERGIAVGIEVRELVPVYGDFNLDLCQLGPRGMLAHLADQLVPDDYARFRVAPSCG